MLCGLDQLFNSPLGTLRKRVRNSRIGVLTHAAAVDRRGRGVLEVLEELGVAPAIVFSPEHGLAGAAQAQKPVEPADEGRDAGIPVVSVYGSTRDSLSPTRTHLEQIDLLLVDLADVGSRYYTYVWTALLAARAAEQSGVHTVILDRPNPITGDTTLCEGTPQRPEFLSFVGLESIPVRHSLTLAEIVAHFWHRDGLALGPDGSLSVVPVRGWERLRTAEAWGRPFVPPSPNMPTLETALVYPGGCLIEGTNLSEGRGTTTPFQVIGAPFLRGARLATSLQELGTPGAMVRPVVFKPTFDKYAGQVCEGLMIHVTNAALFRPIATYLRLVSLARAQAPDTFAFSAEPYEFETRIPAFDLLTGSPDAREAVLGGASPEEVVSLATPVDSAWKDRVAEAEARLAEAEA